MSKHAELIARLEAAEVGSLELDTAICLSLGYVENNQGYSPRNIRISDEDDEWLDYELGQASYTAPIPDVSQSLDAALALAARVLPDVQFNMATGVMGGLPWVQCYLFPQEEDNYLDAEAAATLPLSLCIAILRALDAQEQKQKYE